MSTAVPSMKCYSPDLGKLLTMMETVCAGQGYSTTQCILHKQGCWMSFGQL
jgi:hypothetical protein